MAFKEQRNARGLRKYWGVLGFIMFVALAIIAYVIAPDAVRWADRQFPGFTPQSLGREATRLAAAFILFVILAAIFAGILALTAPKKAIQVRDADLAKEREAKMNYKEMQRKRQRKINRELRERQK